MKTKYFLFILTIAFLFSCAEQERFKISEAFDTPPSPPEYLYQKQLVGGVTLFYKIPENEDVLTIDTEYIGPKGQPIWFSSSYFVDSLNVYGFAEEKEYTVQLYATNRAGIKSTPVSVVVTPLESALPKVAENIEVKPAVRSFLLDWENEVKQTLNIFVSFSYTENGSTKEFTRVFSSKKEIERQFILDLDIDDNIPIHVKVWIEDLYGNKSEVIDKGQFFVIQDEILDFSKPDWVFPLQDTVMGDATMVNASNVEGRVHYVNDGIIDHANITNFMHCNRAAPWDFFIDLGDYYELTRIVTWQRRFHGPPSPGDPSADSNLGALYDNSENVGRYAMWRWDDDTDSWEYLSEHSIPNYRAMGQGAVNIISRHQREGDQAYILPDPGFTKPTRWFRYQALAGFGSNYTSTSAQCLSEISFHGRKAN